MRAVVRSAPLVTQRLRATSPSASMARRMVLASLVQVEHDLIETGRNLEQVVRAIAALAGQRMTEAATS